MCRAHVGWLSIWPVGATSPRPSLTTCGCAHNQIKLSGAPAVLSFFLVGPSHEHCSRFCRLNVLRRCDLPRHLLGSWAPFSLLWNQTKQLDFNTPPNTINSKVEGKIELTILKLICDGAGLRLLEASDGKDWEIEVALG